MTEPSPTATGSSRQSGLSAGRPWSARPAGSGLRCTSTRRTGCWPSCRRWRREAPPGRCTARWTRTARCTATWPCPATTRRGQCRRDDAAAPPLRPARPVVPAASSSRLNRLSPRLPPPPAASSFLLLPNSLLYSSHQPPAPRRPLTISPGLLTRRRIEPTGTSTRATTRPFSTCRTARPAVPSSSSRGRARPGRKTTRSGRPRH